MMIQGKNISKRSGKVEKNNNTALKIASLCMSRDTLIPKYVNAANHMSGIILKKINSPLRPVSERR